MPTPDWTEMTRAFGRIGLLSFGGPAAQISLMHRELVEERRWLDEDAYLRALSLCMLLPGPEAMQLATYAGWKLRGTLGGLLAGTLFVLPGAVVIAILWAIYVSWGDVPVVQWAFLGIKAAVIVIVLAALQGLTKRALNGWQDGLIAGLAFAAIFVFGLPFPAILALAALWGFARTQRSEPVAVSDVSSLNWKETWRTAVIWSALWLVPLALLSLMDTGFLAQVGWFFAWLATISFGGAYALLAYMSQTVVADFGWITTAQMIDALGLAETTPGPLILVTQFVAMLAAVSQGGVWLSLAAAGVSLWATFLPCFLWIFVAGPYVEQLARAPRLSGALSGITAAVVGVIMNLSVWFALNVFFTATQTASEALPSLYLPVMDTFVPTAALLFALALCAHALLKLSLPLVLALSATAGIVLGLSGI